MSNSVPFNTNFIKSVMTEVENATKERMDKIALRAHARLVQRTPVDYGQARAGWNFSINEMDTSAPPKPAREPKTVLPPPEAPGIRISKSGESYHISNFVKHIVYLNDPGTSDKAPRGWIEKEVRDAVKDVENSK